MRAQRLLPAICAAILAGATPPLLATGFVRCEAADGKVTYSNEQCPPNTREVRKVEIAPPVVVHDEARKAQADARQPPRIEAAKPRAKLSPLQEDQQLSAQIAAQQRDCEARARQLQHLQADLAGAAEANRSSAELALRRAQEEFRTMCPKPR